MTTPGEPDPLRRVGGLVLMTTGGLIAGTCGLCTLIFGGGSLVTAIGYGGLQALPSALTLLVLSLVIGGAPGAVGVFLFVLGRRMFRRAHSPGPVDLDTTFS